MNCDAAVQVVCILTDFLSALSITETSVDVSSSNRAFGCSPFISVSFGVMCFGAL